MTLEILDRSSAIALRVIIIFLIGVYLFNGENTLTNILMSFYSFVFLTVGFACFFISRDETLFTKQPTKYNTTTDNETANNKVGQSSP